MELLILVVLRDWDDRDKMSTTRESVLNHYMA